MLGGRGFFRFHNPDSDGGLMTYAFIADSSAVYHNIREFTARVLVAASSLMPLLSVPEPIQT